MTKPSLVPGLKGFSFVILHRFNFYKILLSGHHIVQVACGGGDAQTLAVTDSGLVFSWGDGDYGKLGLSMKLRNALIFTDKFLKDVEEMKVLRFRN